MKIEEEVMINLKWLTLYLMARHHHYFQCRYEVAVTDDVTLVYSLFLPPRLLLPFPDQLATTGLLFQCACTIDQQIPDSDYHLRLVMHLRHDVWMTGWLVFLSQRYLKKKQDFYRVFQKKFQIQLGIQLGPER